MNKKDECESAMRHLISVWASETGFKKESGDHPRFSVFKDWLNSKGYGHYLNFRSTMGADYDADLWFDRELGQIWRR